MATETTCNGDRSKPSTTNSVSSGEDDGNGDIVWALHENGCVFCRPVSTMGFAQRAQWMRTTAEMETRHVVADSSGTTWALFVDGSLNRRVDISTECPEGSEWQLVDYRMDLIDVSFAPGSVWAISKTHGILFRPSMDDDESWENVDAPDNVDRSSLRTLSVSRSGVPYLLTTSGGMYCRVGVTTECRYGDGWSEIERPPVVNQGMWGLLGYTEKPRALVAADKCIWCAVGSKGKTELWRRQVGDAPSAWEQTRVSRHGVASVSCSQVGVHAGALWAVDDRGCLAFCPNASVREAAALEWVDLDSSDGWKQVSLLASKDWLQFEQRQQLNHCVERGESDTEAIEQTGLNGTQQKKSPQTSRRKRQPRRPPGTTDSDLDSITSPAASRKRRHSDSDRGGSVVHGSQKYVRRSGDVTVGLKLPIPPGPELMTKLPTNDKADFMREFEYTFELEANIIAALEDSAPS
ncbi:uncharacterized protein LOC135822979 [Sycon ciliatum]|uniref:uncharacterized protein LOC135822979 n=1 Tax=Sycon ciliatum TaxID=27933 RepID=UPI0020AD47B0|eukprot:scpid58491/ scgid14718/ 